MVCVVGKVERLVGVVVVGLVEVGFFREIVKRKKKKKKQKKKSLKKNELSTGFLVVLLFYYFLNVFNSFLG